MHSPVIFRPALYVERKGVSKIDSRSHLKEQEKYDRVQYYYA